MELKNLNLSGYGCFESSSMASFSINRLNLPAPWEYIYQNRKILLKVDQFGPVYAQAYPPSGIILFKREPFQRYSSWLTWLISPEFAAFSNFFRPNLNMAPPSLEPDFVNIRYTPEAAYYTVEQNGICCLTEITIPDDEPSVIIRTTVSNRSGKSIPLTLINTLRPYVNPAQLAPWDKPEWYLKTGLFIEEKVGFLTRLLNMNSEKYNRRSVVLWSDTENLAGAEISYEKFVGHGTFEFPEAIADGKLRLSPNEAQYWGNYGVGNTLYGYPPVNALQYNYNLQPGESKRLHQTLSLLPEDPSGEFPVLDIAEKTTIYCDDATVDAKIAGNRNKFEIFSTMRSVETPDEALNQYVNEWLPLQMDWVASLDRGWPSGMRGARDSANDFTAMIPLNTEWSREIIKNLMSCQRYDGWFPRQYSAAGRKGKHDLRGHVDAGCWVIELLYEYLCYSKDLNLLTEKLQWLDNDSEDTILEHMFRTIAYYLTEENIGEHGLCKIREGDWLDSVNQAGLKGRGETVTVTNQLIIAMKYVIAILDKIAETGLVNRDNAVTVIAIYRGKIDFFSNNLRNHAFNSSGYFNSVFNDSGNWLFSDKDPDGEKRFYGPANWYSIISGVASPDSTSSIFKQLDFLKSPMGYRVYWPPMGHVPIENVGRSGSGDMPAGLWENGNVYNQGSQGFLARALAVAGKGELLYETLLYLLPYDQEKHPVQETMTPPYAVVNCWQQVPGFMHRGGLQSLTGSIAMGLRIVYDWMLGIRPTLSGLVIDPCIPPQFKSVKAHFKYLDKVVDLEINNPHGRQCGLRSMHINSSENLNITTDMFNGRDVFVAADEMFSCDKNKIIVEL